jgi:hypothetical protein
MSAFVGYHLSVVVSADESVLFVFRIELKAMQRTVRQTYPADKGRGYQTT